MTEAHHVRLLVPPSFLRGLAYGAENETSDEHG